MLSSTPVQHLYTGIFSDERMLQVLHIMQNLSDNCFSKLHEVVNEGRPSTSDYAIRFRKGLDSIEFWKQNIKNEETKQAVAKYKELPILYKYAIVRYLKELFKHDERQVIPVNVPPLQEFIHSYYSKLAKTNYMQKLEFLNVYGLERTHMHMEALRSVLMDFARDSIYQNLNSSSVTGAIRPVENLISGLVCVERNVTPEDSVSQRGNKPFHDEYQYGSDFISDDEDREKFRKNTQNENKIKPKLESRTNEDHHTKLSRSFEKTEHASKTQRQKSPNRSTQQLTNLGERSNKLERMNERKIGNRSAVGLTGTKMIPESVGKSLEDVKSHMPPATKHTLEIVKGYDDNEHIESHPNIGRSSSREKSNSSRENSSERSFIDERVEPKKDSVTRISNHNVPKSPSSMHTIHIQKPNMSALLD
jgi:hypothetical protein